MIWLIAYTTGLIGSFHCIGMCGPIALAIPGIPGESGLKYLYGKLIYNSGRISTYIAMGVLAGFLGLGITITGISHWLSISAGILLLIMTLTPYIRRFTSDKKEYTSTSPIQKYISRQFMRHSMRSQYLAGILNGLLPCGFLYFGIVGSLVTVSPADGGIYMFLFGLGTLPLMMAVSVGRNLFNISFRRKINKYLPAFAILLSCLFIIRGLGLNIPYLSPGIRSNDNGTGSVIECHKISTPSPSSPR